MGGATYSEFRVGHEVSAGSSSTCGTEWDVVVGGSHVLAPQQFLQDLGYQEETRWRSLWTTKSQCLPNTNHHLLPYMHFKCFNIQSRPIEMRATFLYLAYRWPEVEMLLTPLRFLYLVMFSLLAFPSIPQFIAHFWQISSFLCIVLPFSNSYRNESCSKACSAHFATAATLFFSLLLKEQNGGAKKVLKY